MSPPPPYSLGKPMPVWPVSAIISRTSSTRCLKSSRPISSASTRTSENSARFFRTSCRTSAYLPSSSSVSAGTSTAGVTYELEEGDMAQACQPSPFRVKAARHRRAKKFGGTQ